MKRIPVLALACAAAIAGAGGIEATLSNGVRVKAGEGGVAFSKGKDVVAFAPFERKSREGDAPIGIRWSVVGGDAVVAEICGDETRFGEVEPGACSMAAKRLYFGYGWCVEDPGEISAPLNGHNCATRYAGAEFTNGLSVVVAVERAPERLVCSAATKKFGYAVRQPGRYWFVPGTKGAFDCAIRSRKHIAPPRSGGFAAKAGKFCVDLWNGRFREHANLIRRAGEEYSLKGDLLCYVHCWQRHGFDRGLPEVYPPHPAFGTAEELKGACAEAWRQGWDFGVHLNVIDCYPEAAWYAPHKICHERNAKTGKLEPVKAWRNPVHGDQSFRLHHRYAEESARMQIRSMHADGFCPDTVFVDVTSSFSPGFCLDSEGRLSTLNSNVAHNARMYLAVKEELAKRSRRGDAYVSGEAPCDLYAGSIDGGDCQWMHLADEEGPYRWMRAWKSGKVVKTPWFALVHHDRTSLHGAGYSARFEGARGFDFHGIDSDDYVSCEIMGGHSLMADCYNRDAYKAEAGQVEKIDEERCLRQIVRKYWLAQHVVREIAGATVKSVAACGGDNSRLAIEWSTGMKVMVNRGKADWEAETGAGGFGRVALPQYGFIAFNPRTGNYAAVRRRGGKVVEESAHRDGAKTVRYANARNRMPERFIPASPETEVKFADGEFEAATKLVPFGGHVVPEGKVKFTWWLIDPMFREYSAPDAAVCAAEAVAEAGERCVVKFKWPERAKGRRILHVAVSEAGAKAGDTGARYRMLGRSSFYERYRQGDISKSGAYAKYVWEDAHLAERLAPDGKEADFGWVRTRGAWRMVSEEGKPDAIQALP